MCEFICILVVAAALVLLAVGMLLAIFLGGAGDALGTLSNSIGRDLGGAVPVLMLLLIGAAFVAMCWSKRSRQNQYGPVQGWPPVFQASVLSPPVVQGRIVAPPQAPATYPLTPYARDDQALRGVAWSKNQPPNRNMVV
mmetsp:Transcript_93930/g.269235  ORF Transcript_93930/g.269235 Transcript_93930/m.269235 type:complete len:139 (-) Transcript_93930:23-439(-)